MILPTQGLHLVSNSLAHLLQDIQTAVPAPALLYWVKLELHQIRKFTLTDVLTQPVTPVHCNATLTGVSDQTHTRCYNH